MLWHGNCQKIAFFGNIWYGYHLEVNLEYFHMVHVMGSPDGIINSCVFGNMQHGYYLKTNFEYFGMVHVTEASDDIISSCHFWKYMIWVSLESIFWVLSDGNDGIMSHCLFWKYVIWVSNNAITFLLPFLVMTHGFSMQRGSLWGRKVVRCQNANSTQFYFVWYHVSYITLFNWIFCIFEHSYRFLKFLTHVSKSISQLSQVCLCLASWFMWPWSHEFFPFF